MKRRIPKWVLFVVAVVLLLAIAVSVFFATGGTVAALTSRLEELNLKLVHLLSGLNSALLIAALAILPVFGLSAAVFYFIAGAKFGLVGGGVVVAFATSANLLITHAIARSFLRDRIERALERHRHHLPTIPHGAEIAVAAMLVLVPGVPYFARNFLLAISGIPLRIYFAVCVPIYVLRSYLTIYIGDFGMKPTSRQVWIIAGFFILKLTICGLLLHYLRKRFYRSSPGASRP